MTHSAEPEAKRNVHGSAERELVGAVKPVRAKEGVRMVVVDRGVYKVEIER